MSDEGSNDPVVSLGQATDRDQNEQGTPMQPSTEPCAADAVARNYEAVADKLKDEPGDNCDEALERLFGLIERVRTGSTEVSQQDGLSRNLIARISRLESQMANTQPTH